MCPLYGVQIRCPRRGIRTPVGTSPADLQSAAIDRSAILGKSNNSCFIQRMFILTERKNIINDGYFIFTIDH